MATKWGIVSVGKISHDFVNAMRSLSRKEHQIVAVAARDLKRAEDFATLHEIPRAYGSYEDLAKDKDIEVTYIGSITPQHFHISKFMLESGKHVLVEKPMCINLKQTQELISIAKKNDRFLMEALWTRFFPAIKQLTDELTNKTIGEILHVNVSAGYNMENINDRISKKSLGGGATLVIGCYAIFAILHVFGEEPLEIKTVGKINDEGVDRHLASSFLFSNVRTAQATISICATLSNEIEIIGTKGIIKVPNGFIFPTQLITPEKTYDFPLPDSILPNNYPNSSGLRYQAEAVRNCLLKGLKECPEMSYKSSEINAIVRDHWKRELGVVFPEDNE